MEKDKDLIDNGYDQKLKTFKEYSIEQTSS